MAWDFRPVLAEGTGVRQLGDKTEDQFPEPSRSICVVPRWWHRGAACLWHHTVGGPPWGARPEARGHTSWYPPLWELWSPGPLPGSSERGTSLEGRPGERTRSSCATPESQAGRGPVQGCPQRARGGGWAGPRLWGQWVRGTELLGLPTGASGGPPPSASSQPSMRHPHGRPRLVSPGPPDSVPRGPPTLCPGSPDSMPRAPLIPCPGPPNSVPRAP